MHPFWLEIEQLAAATAGAVVPALLGAYLNKSAGIPGAPPITIANVGRIAGTVAASAVFQHIAATQQAAAQQPAA